MSIYLAHCRWYYKKNGVKKELNCEGNIFIEFSDDSEVYEDIIKNFKKLKKELLKKHILKEVKEINNTCKITRTVILNMTKIAEDEVFEKKEEKKNSNYITHFLNCVLALLLCAIFYKL